MLILAGSAFAESKTEKQLRAQVAELTQRIDLMTAEHNRTAVKKIVTEQIKTIHALDRNAQLTRDAIQDIGNEGDKSETAVAFAREESKATRKTLAEVTENQKATLRILVVLAGCVAGLIAIVFMLAKRRSVCSPITQS